MPTRTNVFSSAKVFVLAAAAGQYKISPRRIAMRLSAWIKHVSRARFPGSVWPRPSVLPLRKPLMLVCAVASRVAPAAPRPSSRAARSSPAPVPSRSATISRTPQGARSRPVHRAGRFDAAEMELVPPVSRDDSFAQAREAIAAVCAKRAKKAGKKRRSSGKALAPLRVAVELPLASDAPADVRAMVAGACAGGVVGTAVYGDAAAAASPFGGEDDVREHVHIDDALRGLGCDLAMGEGAVALVGVADDQVAAARRVAELAGARPVVGVNVEWFHAGDGGVTFRAAQSALQSDGPPSDPVSVFANSFSVVYSYLPLAIKGVTGATTEGAVFKCVRGGAPEGSPWRILVKDDAGEYQQVGAMQRRPEQEDLESALYNAAAAKSKINQGIGLFRGLADKAKNAVTGDKR